MKKEDIDKLIAESLGKEEAEFYNKLEEESFFQGVRRMYTGKFAWMVIVTTIVQIPTAALGFYCAYVLFNSESIMEIMKYGSAMFIALIMTSMIKVWHWMQIDKNAIILEMKRLEYQVAVLMEKTSENK